LTIDRGAMIRLDRLSGPAAVGAARQAVLPLGALEHHGGHLPLGTDTLIVEAILDRAAPAHPGLRLPALWLGASDEHVGFPGTSSQSPEAVIAQTLAAGAGVARLGCDQLVLLNGHGGNIAALEIAALRLRSSLGLRVVNAHWLDFGLPDGLDPPAPPELDWHGGWIESAAILAIDPALVDVGGLAAHPATSPACLLPHGRLRWGWRAEDVSPTGVIGDPRGATAAIGQRLLDHAARALERLLADLLAAPPLTPP
jgi:creatinine amidohydrolase